MTIQFKEKIPPLMASKIQKEMGAGPLSRQFRYSDEEKQNHGDYDPIGDQVKYVTSQLVHRYRNRALFLATKACPIHCRYCFRRNELSEDDPIFKPDFPRTLEYLKSHPEIEEIIFSGGDPFSLSDSNLDEILKSLGECSHIQFFRFHTRYPTTIPKRFTPQLLEVLKKHLEENKKIIIVIHTNHRSEWSDEALEAIKKLQLLSIPILTQSVLLKGVNDHPETLINLFRFLEKNSMRPYYLHHPDKVEGGMHFYLSKKEGLEIYRQIKRELSGWMVPQYVIDSPEATGKTPVLENPLT
ncbi:MAG: KamA family radical SAM protein [Halobacteriovoraceae bacterium]|nr:KamA family radical SAM protein [Halobacteriovoraceae bacterium]